jgi:dihydrofolate reductase
MTISIVVAADENYGIGKDNQLPWHLPADLKHFKDFTIGYPIIMGRKTFDSVGKPLPKRRNIVITTQNLQIEGCEVVHSIDEAFKICKGEEKIAIVGGATIFEQSMEFVDVIHFTRIHHTFEADTFFPVINPDKWTQADIERHEPDEKNLYPYSFITYRKA